MVRLLRTGHRRFALEPNTDSDSDTEMERMEEDGGAHTFKEDSKTCSNALLVWRFGACTIEVQLGSSSAEAEHDLGPASIAGAQEVSDADLPAGHENVNEPEHVVEAGLCDHDQAGDSSDVPQMLGENLQTPHLTDNVPNG